MHRIVKLTTICLVVLSLGLHWALLQTVAWTSMMWRYSRNTSLPMAVVKTFDGKHPCPLCHAVQKGRAEEQQRHSPQNTPEWKLDLAVLCSDSGFIITPETELIPRAGYCVTTRAEAPPKPRPRT